MKSKGQETTSGSTAPPAAAQTVTVRSLLVGWANQQDGWVRQLVSEIIIAGNALTDAQLDAIYQLFLKEKALAPGGPVSVAQLSDDQSALVAGSGLFLTQLGDLKNVNALAESQKIDFNAKLTIVFGENACGKTGYVRVLKKAAAVRPVRRCCRTCLRRNARGSLLPRESPTSWGKAMSRLWIGKTRRGLFRSIA